MSSNNHGSTDDPANKSKWGQSLQNEEERLVKGGAKLDQYGGVKIDQQLVA